MTKTLKTTTQCFVGVGQNNNAAALWLAWIWSLKIVQQFMLLRVSIPNGGAHPSLMDEIYFVEEHNPK
jgi:hypothetical protein